MYISLDQKFTNTNKQKTSGSLSVDEKPTSSSSAVVSGRELMARKLQPPFYPITCVIAKGVCWLSSRRRPWRLRSAVSHEAAAGQRTLYSSPKNDSSSWLSFFLLCAASRFKRPPRRIFSRFCFRFAVDSSYSHTKESSPSTPRAALSTPEFPATARLLLTCGEEVRLKSE